MRHIAFRKNKTIQSYFDEQNFPKEVPVICVLNGEPVLRKDWKKQIKRKDDLRFVIVPRGRAFLSLVIQVVVTVGLLLLHVPLPVAIAAGTAAASIFNILLPPKVGSSQNEASPTYSLNAQGNSARLLSPIPKGYGLHNMYPDFASQPYVTYINNDQYLYQLFCLGLAEYDVRQVRIQDTVVWDSVNGYSDSFEDVEIEIIPPGSPVTLFPSSVQSSLEVTGEDMLSGTTLGPFVVNTAGTVVNKIAFDFIFPTGLFHTDKKGKVQSRTVQVQNQVRLIDDSGTPLGPWITVGSPTYTRATSTAQRFTETYNVSPGRYEAQTMRVTPDAAGNDLTTVDRTQWAGLRGFEPSDNIYDGVTLLAVKIKATNQLSQQASRLFNVVQMAKVPVWDGTRWSDPVPTQSIAWAVTDMLRSSDYGEGRPDSLIDLDKLLVLDQIWTQRGDTFNAVFDTARTFWEALGLVLAVGRTQPMLVAGVCTFMRDEPRTIPKGVFAPNSIRKGSFSIEHILYDDATTDDVIVEYQDERTWKPADATCTLDGSKSENPTRINMFGITNYAQAWREGMYQAACNMYRRVTTTVSLEMLGKLVIRGDSAIVSHDVPNWGTSGSVVAYDPVTRTLELDEPCNWVGGPFLLYLTNRNGTSWGPVSVTRGDDDDFCVIDQASLDAVEESAGDLEDLLVIDPNRISTRFVHGSTLSAPRQCIVVSCEPQSSETFEVSFINDDLRVYTADNGSPPDEAGTIPVNTTDGPAVGGLTLVIDPTASVASAASFTASWRQAGGATSYVFQISYDGSSWETLYEGTNTTTSFVAQTNNIVARVAAIGVVRGPWNYFTDDYTNVTSVPRPIDDLRVYVGVNNTQITGYWSPTLLASTYVYDVTVVDENGDDQIVISGETAAYSMIITQTTINQAGGPWQEFKVHVTAKNSYGVASPATFEMAGSSIVTSPSYLTVSSATPASISVTGPNDSSWAYIRVFKAATDDFTTAVQVGDDLRGSPNQVFTFTDTVAAGTSYFWAQAFNETGAYSNLAGPVQAGASSGVGSGGGGGGTPTPPDDGGSGGGGNCVTDDTPILLANSTHDGPGETKLAADMLVGDQVWTMDENTLEWGAFQVLAVQFATAPIMRADHFPCATPDHRFFVDGRWVRMDRIGAPAGLGRVMKMTVATAHTYVSLSPEGDHVISHNVKKQPVLQ